MDLNNKDMDYNFNNEKYCLNLIVSNKIEL